MANYTTIKELIIRSKESLQKMAPLKTPTEIFESYKKLLLSMKVLSRKLLFVSLLLLLSVITGFFIAQSNPEWTNEFVSAVGENFLGLASKSNAVLWFYIFVHNLSVSVMLIMFFFLFGVAPILALSSNGLTIGVIIAYSINKIGLTTVFLAITPHGIFEIPGFLIAASLSLYLSKNFSLFLRKKSKNKFKRDLFFSLKITLLVIVPLLFIASIIETFITPLLLSA